jgi:phenylpropionate dioxygenase-like ring-hydroxylating dioxygenase large terminal subunit
MAPILALILPGLYYPLRLSTDILASTPSQIIVDGTPLAAYRNKTGSSVVHSDVCPHQGAYLSGGWINPDGKLSCPYHGFCFDHGRYTGITPFKENRETSISLPLWKTHEAVGIVWGLLPCAIDSDIRPHEVPEAQDPNFRVIHGARVIHARQEAVTENVLDSLHISYVHSFGSRVLPLPEDVKYTSLSDTSGRTTFTYSPREGTLSTWLGRKNLERVVIENEFYLPSTTVTRVKVRNDIKTVVTHSLPLSASKTMLFFSVYRNFWCDDLGIGDIILRKLMDRTLDEDVTILRQLDPGFRTGPISTPYDVTIRRFRKAQLAWITKTFPGV